MFKLIATDIDGTLLDSERSISKETAAAFDLFDLPKVLISARMPQAMHYLQTALSIERSPMVCYNGALVLDDDQVLLDLSIEMELVKNIAQIALDNDLHVSLYRHDEWFVPEMDHWAGREKNNTRVQPSVQEVSNTLDYLEKTNNKGGVHKIMLMGDATRMDTAYCRTEEQHGKQVHLYRSKDTYTEITPARTSKLYALKVLLEKVYPRIAIKDVAAFGDNYNDVDMLGAVGYGVAVANARPEAMAAARYTTAHHKENGVAAWLRQYRKGGL